MKKFSEYRKVINEGLVKTYHSGTGYSAKVYSKDGKHVAKFFRNGEYMKHADYEDKSLDDVHDFAQDEMAVRAKEQRNESLNIQERINEPQGREHPGDPISKDTEEGSGPKKKMMGNRTPLEIIAKILAKG